jgi:hypothetical protein
MERRIEIRPAYDRRHPDPKKSYGIHNAELCFYLIGPEGAIQFIVSTGWHLPHVMEEMKAKHAHNADTYALLSKGWGTDIGYHARVPQYENQTPISGNCQILGGTCYYDGSTLNAEPIFNRMVAEGHEAVWEEMEEYYLYRFSEQAVR